MSLGPDDEFLLTRLVEAQRELALTKRQLADALLAQSKEIERAQRAHDKFVAWDAVPRREHLTITMRVDGFALAGARDPDDVILHCAQSMARAIISRMKLEKAHHNPL